MIIFPTPLMCFPVWDEIIQNSWSTWLNSSFMYYLFQELFLHFHHPCTNKSAVLIETHRAHCQNSRTATWPSFDSAGFHLATFPDELRCIQRGCLWVCLHSWNSTCSLEYMDILSSSLGDFSASGAFTYLVSLQWSCFLDKWF
jgi:hypothetical protein